MAQLLSKSIESDPSWRLWNPFVKRLPDEILEDIAETICGSGSGSGGGYTTPGPYRSMWQIREFFQRVGMVPAGDSGTRKWFALESLRPINGSPALKAVILRLASPLANDRNIEMAQKVTTHLNKSLQFEGLAIELHGISPTLVNRTTDSTISRPASEPTNVAPKFATLVKDAELANILVRRWTEAQNCQSAGAYLAAIVMMGSVLEGLLIDKVKRSPEQANRSDKSPKHVRSAKPRDFADWGLSDLIDVAYDIGWLQSDISKFNHVLREFRNLIHPQAEQSRSYLPTENVCRICWEVVNATIEELNPKA